MANQSSASKKKSESMDSGAVTPKQAMHVVRGFASDRSQTNFDRIIHDRLRLAIVSALAVNEKLTFTELKQLLDASDGNLSVHARKLEEAGYITVSKYFDGRIPKTEYRITQAGRKALDAYLEHMEALIQVMRNQ